MSIQPTSRETFQSKLGVISLTYFELSTLMTSNLLRPGYIYEITDSGVPGSVFIEALTSNTLSPVAKKLQGNIISLNGYGTIPVWVYQSYSIGDEVIWGAQIWQNVNGNPGSSVDDFNLDAEWVVQTSHVEYYEKVFDIKYDFLNDRITEQSDEWGNVISYDFNILNSWRYVTYTDWGNYQIITNNRCYGIINNKDWVSITGNVGCWITNNVNISSSAGIISNFCFSITGNSTYGGIAYNNITGSIENNGCDSGGIYYNTNNGNIYNNAVTVGNISYNSNKGSIQNCNTSPSLGVVYNSNLGNIENTYDTAYNSNSGSIYYGVANTNTPVYT